jgi:hypothetical protein
MMLFGAQQHTTLQPSDPAVDECAVVVILSSAVSPIARLKFSMSTSVFFTSLLYTSLPTMGQNGT